MMTLADLETAVRYRLPLIVLVMNNGGFAATLWPWGNSADVCEVFHTEGVR